MAFIAQICRAIINLCGSWAQSIRDSEFLVEMRLRNLEPPESPNGSSPNESGEPGPDPDIALPEELKKKLEVEAVGEADLLENVNQ